MSTSSLVLFTLLYCYVEGVFTCPVLMLYNQVDETQEVVESLLACEFLGLARMQDVPQIMERAIAEVAAEAEELSTSPQLDDSSREERNSM